MKDLYDFLASNNISPNALFAMHCVYNNYMYKNYINTVPQLMSLEAEGCVTKIDKQFSVVYKLTDKGLMILKEAEMLFGSVSQEKTNGKIPLQEWENYITLYNETFPRKLKPGTNLGFRTNPKELMKKFLWFFKEYPEYTWDMVLEATKKYVSTFDESTGYTYMQTSGYFLKKQDNNRNVNSTLANMCYNIKEGIEDEIQSGFHYFGP